MRSNDVEQLVAIQHVAALIHHHEAVAITVEGNADVRSILADLLHEQLRVRGAAPIVDVHAAGLSAHDDRIRAKLFKNARSDVIRGAVRAIEHDPQALQTKAAIDRCLTELDVAACSVRQPGCATEAVGAHADHLAFELCFDLQLDGIGQFVSAAIEELDAVVVVRVVGGRNHDSGVRAQRAREVGDRGRRHGAEQANVDASAGEAGLEHRLQHVA